VRARDTCTHDHRVQVLAEGRKRHATPARRLGGPEVHEVLVAHYFRGWARGRGKAVAQADEECVEAQPARRAARFIRQS
jgi:hypothetical protein